MKKRPPKPEDVESAPRTRTKRSEQPPTASPIQALSDLSRAEPRYDDFLLYQEEIKAERNDRGAAILMSQNVDNALERALSSRLNLPTISARKEVFGANAPLGTFSNKIRMAQALNIIGPATRSVLDLIRHVRNAFAHSIKPISFANNEVKKVVSIIPILPVRQPAGLFPVTIALLSHEETRDRFTIITSITSHGLIGYSNDHFQQFLRDDPGRYQTVLTPMPLP